MAQQGHEVANHTWDHPDLSNVDTDTFLEKVGDTIEFIQNNTGQISAAEALILPLSRRVSRSRLRASKFCAQ